MFKRCAAILLWLVTACAFAVTLNADPNCPKPTISNLATAWETPDEHTLLVTFDLTVYAPAAYVELFYRVDNGAWVGAGTAYVSGPRTIQLGNMCTRDPGAHPVTVLARCNNTPNPDRETVASTEFTKSPHAEITSLDLVANGNGTRTALVGYRFRGVTAPANRDVSILFNGQWTDAPDRNTTSGTVSFGLGTGCLDAGAYPVTARAVACGSSPYNPQIDEKTSVLTIPEKGEIDVNALYDPVTNIVKLSGSFERPAGVTSGFPTITALPQATNNGGATSPSTVPATFTQQPDGSFDFTAAYTPVGSPQTVSFVARFESCNAVIDDVASTGCGCSEQSGDPVYYTDGNVRYSDSDPLPTILGHSGLRRTYDSNHTVQSLFGRGWSSMLDSRLFVTPAAAGNIIGITTPANENVSFVLRGGAYKQLWPKGENGSGALSLQNGVYVYRRAGSTDALLYRESDGRFAGYRELGTGHELRVDYVNGLPSSVSDSWTGVTWTITTDPALYRVTSIASNGATWQYAYDTAGNLTAVTVNQASWRTYEYADNRMTAARDALGNLIESHTYDTSGRGISSTGPTDTIANIEHGAAGTTSTRLVTRVTAKSGAVTDYIIEPAGGSWRTVQIIGGCTSCGTQNRTYAHDSAGHVVREQNAAGYVTLREYTGGRMTLIQSPLRPSGCDPEVSPTQCRLDSAALGAATLEAIPSMTQITTFEYADPVWPDRATARSTSSVLAGGENRRESTVFHPLTGETLSTSVRGFTAGTNGQPAAQNRVTQTALYDGSEAFAPAFAPGGSFDTAWLALAQPAYLRKAIDGLRTDVMDVTEYVYYPVDATVPANLRGRLAAVRNAAGHITRIEAYDAFGNATRVVDANGVVTETTFDPLGRPLLSTLNGISGCNTADDPLCAANISTSRTYLQTTGPLETEVRAGGGVTSYTYDARGRVATVSRGPSVTALAERVEFQYDALTDQKSLERLLAYENGSWVEKKRETYAYDSFGRLQDVIHSDNTSVAYTYDAAGRMATVRDENHASPNTTYVHDPEGRVARVTQALSGAPGGTVSTLYTYDPHGNLASVTDPNGNVTQYAYDDFGVPVSQQSPVTGTTSYRYDSGGNLVSTTDANGATTVRTYDALGRVLSAVSSRTGVTPETVTWTYDDPTPGRFTVGRLASMSDPAGTTSYAYDRRGLVRVEQRAFSGGAGTAETKYAYDSDGNVSRVDYPSGAQPVVFTHDYAGRPLTAAVPGSVTVVQSAAYLPFGPARSIIFGNGTAQSMEYDARYRMTENKLAVVSSGATIARYGYSYDAIGNVTAITDLTDSAWDRTFGYDDLNRLTTANTGTALWGTGAYTYDRMGNLLSARIGDPALTIHAKHAQFTYVGTTPKIATVRNHALSDDPDGLSSARPRPASHAVGYQTISYDAAGNEMSYVATRTYSPRNLLASVTEAAEVPSDQHRVEYKYDGRGVRVTRSESQGGGALASRYYTYSPSMQLLAITNDDAANIWAAKNVRVQALPSTRHQFIWFGNRPVVQISSSFPTGPHWYFTDHLGTPILQTDANAAVAWRVEYEPYGEIWLQRVPAAVEEGPTPRVEQPLRFPGQEAALTWEGTEERYNIHRWYRAGWGRYTQDDPVNAFRAGELSHYEYADGRPLNLIDPLGLYTVSGSCKDCTIEDQIDQVHDPVSNYILSETSAFCRTRLNEILDVNLRRCIQRSCEIGRVECETGGPCRERDLLGYVRGFPWVLRVFPSRTATVCIYNAYWRAHRGWAGDIVIHEWAHGCGYNPDRPGGIPGIP